MDEAAPADSSSGLSNAAPAEMGISASQMAKHPHRNNKKLAAIVTLVVALLLAGVAIYVYVSANNNTETSSKTNKESSSEQTAKSPESPRTTVQGDRRRSL